MVQVVLVNKKDEVLGLREKYSAHQHPVPLHRAISVVIYDPQKQKVLLQKRALNKPTWPGFWSNTVCTHPLPKEAYLACAHRRLKEEMGFDCSLTPVFSFIYQARYNDTWGEYELDWVFVGSYRGKVKPNPDEVADYRWIKVSELGRDFKNHSDQYTPWFKKLWANPFFKS